MRSIITLSMVLFALSSWAQDIIIKNDKSELKTKVLEITETAIKYKKFEVPDGPTYNINKNEVFMIIYKNGTKEYMENKTSVVSNSQGNGQNEIRTVNTTGNDGYLCFGPKHKALHLGFGIGAAGYAEAGSTMAVPPIQLRYEFAISPKVSFGALISMAESSFDMYQYTGDRYEDYRTNYTMFVGRGNYHFATSDRIDPYAGIGLGYSIVSGDDWGDDSGHVFAGAQIGANFYFSKNFGVWAELGYGISIFNLGLTFKFK